MKSTLRQQIETCVNKGMIAASHLVSKYAALKNIQNKQLKTDICTKQTEEKQQNKKSKSKSKQKHKQKKSANLFHKLQQKNYLLQSLISQQKLMSNDERYFLKSSHLSSISQHSEHFTPSKNSNQKTMKKQKTIQSNNKNNESVKSLNNKFKNNNQKHNVTSYNQRIKFKTNKTPKQQTSTHRFNRNTSPKKLFHDTTIKSQIIESLINPERFQRILVTSLITVQCRILPSKLIEMQIVPKSKINRLQIILLQQGCQCQNINEVFQDPPCNKIITLFTSVRTVKVETKFVCPKIKLNLQYRQCMNESIEYKQKVYEAIIPLTWLHCVDQQFHQKHKSIIRTKTFVEGLQISKNTLLTLQRINNKMISCQQVKKSKTLYEWGFILDDHHYQINVQIQNNKLNIQIEGRGEQILRNMLIFLQHILS